MIFSSCFSISSSNEFQHAAHLKLTKDVVIHCSTQVRLEILNGNFQKTVLEAHGKLETILFNLTLLMILHAVDLQMQFKQEPQPLHSIPTMLKQSY